MSANATLDPTLDGWAAETDTRAFVASGIAALAREWDDARTRCPLVAVAGVCGGAGATTVAHLTALAAAAGDEAVAVAELGGPGAALAELAGVEPSHSLSALAAAVAAHGPSVDSLFDDIPAAGPRVLAGRRELTPEADPAALDRVLSQTRRSHTLAIVDCGVPGNAAACHVLAEASHRLWVLPATDVGARAGRALLDLFPTDPDRRELLVARHRSDAGRPAIDALKALSGERGTPLVLLPEVGDLATGDPDAAVERAGVGLDAILMAVRR